MNVRLFNKRGAVWLDIRANGYRVRKPTGRATEEEAKLVTPAIVAEVLASWGVGRSNGPATGTVPQERQELPQKEPKGMTLWQAFELGLKTREKWIKAKSTATLEGTFWAAIAGTPGLKGTSEVKLLTREFVRTARAAWLAEEGKRSGSKLSASTINHRLSLWSTLLEVADLPAHGVKHLPTKGNERARRVSDAELEAMQEWCRKNPERPGCWSFAHLLIVGLETGARQGELLKLAWGDVGPGRVTFKDTKNGRSRTIPLTEKAVAVLEARRDLTRPFSDLTKDRVVARWAEMRASMGLAHDEDFVFHILRHEFGSRLGDRGENAYTIMALMGHENIKTSQVYVKASLGAMERALGIRNGDG